MTQQEKLQVVAEYMGYEYWPACSIPTYEWEVEQWELELLDKREVWVKGATDEFRKTPCTSSYYWDMERGLPEQWEDYKGSLWYSERWDELIPVVQKVLQELGEMLPAPIKDEKGKDLWMLLKLQEKAIEQALLALDISKVFEATVQAIEVINNYKRDGSNR